MAKKRHKDKAFSFKIPKFDKLLESIDDLENLGSDSDKKPESSREPADESKDKSASVE